jgi:hypothetical protein
MHAAHLLGFRIVVALAQGGALYGLFEHRAALTEARPGLFAALLMLAVVAPLLAHVSAGAVAAGEMGGRAMALWLALAGVVLAALGWFGFARGALPAWSGGLRYWPDFRLFAAVAAALFVAHVRVADCLAERRAWPSYARHFDTAWKLALQLGLAAAFLGVFWLILTLADALFALVGVKLWAPVFAQGWFAWPASALAIGLALHATDVQPALIRGVRTVGLLLFAWLLPLLVLVLGGFLGTLAVAGIGPLWGTGRAGAIVLSACAALVLLVNAAYQDGSIAERARLLRLSLRAGALLVLPLAAIAAWALGLRVAQHGWSAERVIAGAVTLLAGSYGIGYVLAALRPGLRGFQATNHLAAHLAVALVLALATPLADPARLMVASQVARLESGAVPPERFDFLALRLDGARWGSEALRGMVAQNRPGIATAASDALTAEDGSARYKRRRAVDDPAGRFTPYPPGTPMPDGLLAQVAGDRLAGTPLRCLTSRRTDPCMVRALRLSPEGPEMAIVYDNQYGGVLLSRQPGEAWRMVGRVSPVSAWCHGRHEGWLTRETLEVAPPVFPDLMAGTTRLRINPVEGACER